MKHLKFATVCAAFFFLAVSCNNAAEEKTPAADKPAEATAAMATKPDMAKIKTEIQALESSWATADNARDTNTIAAFYSDDAISMSNNKPMQVGKAAILNDIKAGLAKKVKGSTVSYDVMGVYGDENQVTEAGKTTTKDASGKVTYTGKYMAVWEKRNGKYICIRDISNDDMKEK